MIPRGQFRHHPAKFGVQFHLAVKHVRQQTLPVVVQRHAGLVTRGFDA